MIAESGPFVDWVTNYGCPGCEWQSPVYFVKTDWYNTHPFKNINIFDKVNSHICDHC